MAVAAGTRTGAHLGRVTIYTGESIRRVGMPIGGPGDRPGISGRRRQPAAVADIARKSTSPASCRRRFWR